MMYKNLRCSYASIFRRCHSFRVTWSGAKSVAQKRTGIGRICLTFSPSWFRLAEENFLRISKRRTTKGNQFKLLVLCFILTSQVKRLIGFKWILSSQEHRCFNSNRPFPSSRVLPLRNESMCETLHIKISPHAVSISCKSKSKEWFRT